MQGIAVAVDVGTGGEVVLLFEAGNFKGEGEGDGDPESTESPKG